MINPKDLEVEKIILRRGTTFITNKLNSVIETEKVTFFRFTEAMFLSVLI